MTDKSTDNRFREYWAAQTDEKVWQEYWDTVGHNQWHNKRAEIEIEYRIATRNEASSRRVERASNIMLWVAVLTMIVAVVQLVVSFG